MKDANELSNALAHFSGTDEWYRHALNHNMLYTEGVKFFAENAGGGAYWFLDIVATELFQMQGVQPFQHIKMNVMHTEARISADDGDGNVFWTRDIDYTDCPAGEWRFYLTDNVLLLPGEY